GPGAHAGAGAVVPGQGVPGGALRAAGAGVPGAGVGRAVQRGGGEPGGPAELVPDAGGDGAGPETGGAGGGAAGEGGAAGGDRRVVHLVGRGVGGAGRLLRPRAGAGVLERRRARVLAERAPAVLPAHAEGRAERGGPGVRDRDAVRLPVELWR